MSVTEASFAEGAVGTVGAVLKDAPEEEVDVALAGIAAEDFLSGAVVGEVVSGAGCCWEKSGLALLAASPAVAASEAEVGACAFKLGVRFEPPRFDELKFDALKFEETELEAPKFEIAKFEAARFEVRGAKLL